MREFFIALGIVMIIIDIAIIIAEKI